METARQLEDRGWRGRLWLIDCLLTSKNDAEIDALFLNIIKEWISTLSNVFYLQALWPKTSKMVSKAL